MDQPNPQIILYPGRKGRPDFALRVDGGTVWLTQAETAELFQATTPNINIHIRNILKERELDTDSVVEESLITAADGKNYRTKLYGMLEFNEHPFLQGPGRMRHSRTKEIVGERYEEFDGRRRETERLAADAEDVKALESLAKDIEAVKTMKKRSKPSANQAGEEVGG